MVSVLAWTLLAADPAARLDAFIKAHPTFVAVTEYAVNGKTVGRSTIRAQRRSRVRFDAKAPALDYALSVTESRYVELDRMGKVYDELPASGRLQLYASRISPGGELLPSFLLADSTLAALRGGQPTVVGDELRATYATDQGPVEVHLTVNAKGQPTRYEQIAGGNVRSWRVISYAPGSSRPEAYRLSVPLGYVPYALPELSTPLAIGSVAPLAGWTRAGRPLDLGEARRGSPRLLAVLGADCAASRAARPFLVELGRSMPVFLIGPGEIVDPTGAQMKRLSPPGTPMFYLVGGDGKVAALWFGFDKSKGEEWEAQVRAAAQEGAN